MQLLVYICFVSRLYVSSFFHRSFFPVACLGFDSPAAYFLCSRNPKSWRYVSMFVDLLCVGEAKNLQIREFRTQGPSGKEIKVMGLTEEPVRSYYEILEKLEYGAGKRATGKCIQFVYIAGSARVQYKMYRIAPGSARQVMHTNCVHRRECSGAVQGVPCSAGKRATGNACKLCTSPGVLACSTTGEVPCEALRILRSVQNGHERYMCYPVVLATHKLQGILCACES